MKTPITHNGYIIYPVSYELRDSGKWTIAVDIMRRTEVRRFMAGNQYSTKEEALRSATEFGRAIIDGKVPPCRVDDIG